MDVRTDVYALGAVAYHVVTGVPPFAADTPIAVGFAHCTQPIRPPTELRSDLPAATEAAIVRALAKEEVPSLFGSIELGFARIDLVGAGEAERLSVSLFGTARWPILSRVSHHVERARFEVHLDGSVRNVSASDDLTDGFE